MLWLSGKLSWHRIKMLAATPSAFRSPWGMDWKHGPNPDPGVSIKGGTTSYHPAIERWDFPVHKKHPALGDPPWRKLHITLGHSKTFPVIHQKLPQVARKRCRRCRRHGTPSCWALLPWAIRIWASQSRLLSQRHQNFKRLEANLALQLLNVIDTFWYILCVVPTFADH